MENKVVRGRLIIEIIVKCPYCDGLIDILDPDRTAGYDHNDDGYIFSQVFPEGNWSEQHGKFEIEDIECDDCGGLFDVRGLDW